MTQPKQYPNPPLIEALCELFYADSPWDETTVGRFYAEVKDDFPTRRQQEIHEARFEFPAQGTPEAGVKQVATRMQFVSPSGDRLIQVARDLLVVNQLRPYPGFDAWEPTIRRAADVYAKVVGPTQPRVMAMRYINRVVVPEPEIQMHEYFMVYPQMPANWQDHQSFLIRAERQVTPGARTILTFGTADAPDPGRLAFLLDLYIVYDDRDAMMDLGAAARRAHEQIEATFEASITERLRHVFKQEPAS